MIINNLNFGMGPTLIRFFSKAVADDDDNAFRKTSSTAQFFTFSAGLIGAIIFICCYPWFCKTYVIGDDLRGSAFILFCGMSFHLWQQLFTTVFYTILQSYQRLDITNYLRSGVVIFRVVALITFYELFQQTLATLGFVLVLEATIQLFFLWFFSLRYGGKKTLFSFRNVDIKIAPKLFAFGALVFINSVAMGLSIQIPSLIIGATLGKNAVADYSAALTVTSFLSSVLAAIVVPLTPLASIEAKNGGKRLGVWAVSIGQAVACAGYCAVLILWLFGRDWITAWLGAEFAWTRFVVVIVATATVLAAVQHTNFTIALGASSIVPVAVSSVVMAIAIIGGCALGLGLGLFEKIPFLQSEAHPTDGAGLLGVAWLIFFVRIGRNVLYLPSVYAKKFDYSYPKYLFKVYLTPLVAAVCVFLIWKFAFAEFDFDALQATAELKLRNLGLAKYAARGALVLVACLKSGIAAVLYAAICWFAVLPKELKRSLFGVLRKKLT